MMTKEPKARKPRNVRKIDLADEAFDVIEGLKSEYGISQKRSIRKVIEWFSKLPREQQIAILMDIRLPPSK